MVVVQLLREHSADRIAPSRDTSRSFPPRARMLEEPYADAHLLVHCRAFPVPLQQWRRSSRNLPADRIFEKVLRIHPETWPNRRRLQSTVDMARPRSTLPPQ